MNQYLIDQEFGTENLIQTIYKEETEHQQLTDKFNYLKQRFDVLNWDFSTAENSEDFSDMQIQDKFVRMAKFSDENKLPAKKAELDALENSILKKQHSISSLAMSLLQIAKQGISTVHGALLNCPNGKMIGSETLKNVIWQARNQSIHFEEGNPNQYVKNCFKNLANDFGENYDLTTNYKLNRAKQIIDLLSWKDYENYKNDMISLIG